MYLRIIRAKVFKHSYGYDGFGNWWLASQANLPTGVNVPASSGWYNIGGVTTNRMNGVTYDQAGNLTQLSPNTGEYDAENRLKKVVNGATVVAENFYDGTGKRVKKTLGSDSAVYIYDVGGNLMMEQGGSIVTAGTQYLLADHLGSTRMVLGSDGTCLHRIDYLPFGGESPRTEPCYGGDPPTNPSNVSLKFTGKERDAETGLDYFGARYMSSTQGRFTSPDAPFADQHVEDPQSWNLYAYVRNNPLAHVDPTGEACFALNSRSAFCGRATEYGQIDARVSGQTRFFAAASAVSQALANSDIGYGGFISRLTPQISGSTQQFLGAVGQDLLQMNRTAAADIQSGKLGGPDLDARMVHMEQSKVQGSLDALKKSDPAAYKTLIAESNAGLNPTDRMRQVGSVYSTDKAYLGVLDGVRKQLGRNIDFSKQSDREAIGNALIHHIRQKGGCDVTGDKVTVCQ